MAHTIEEAIEWLTEESSFSVTDTGTAVDMLRTLNSGFHAKADEIARLEDQVRRLKKSNKSLSADANEAELERDQAKDLAERFRRRGAGEVWLWEDDLDDNPLDLLNCEVLITVDQLRSLISKGAE